MAPIVPRLATSAVLERGSRAGGVDEVGVAPTCGAVVAAAVMSHAAGCHRIPGVRDSRRCPPRSASASRRSSGRERGCGRGRRVRARDRPVLNIYHDDLAMRRAIARLGGHEHVLFEPDASPASRPPRNTNIVDGDAVGLHDRLRVGRRQGRVRPDDVAALAGRYPGYGWDRNQGYAPSSTGRRSGARPDAVPPSVVPRTPAHPRR